MDFQSCVRGRRSIRRYTNEKIEHSSFEQIIELARYAPSWKNTQTTRYTLVQDKEVLQAIAEHAVLGFSYNTKTILQCPNLVILSTITKQAGFEEDGTASTRKHNGWEMFDSGIAAQTFCLSAYELGYGTVIMGIFDDLKIHEILALPENQTVSAIIAIGKYEKTPKMPPRKEVADLVTYK